MRARFGFTDDDLELVREWLANSNVRWGLGTAERAGFGLERLRQGTFDAGLDRIALGVVAEETDDEWLGTALPLAGVEARASTWSDASTSSWTGSVAPSPRSAHRLPRSTGRGPWSRRWTP